MLTIDGSAGEGGGQILRSALALALVTGTPFRIDNIRGKRRKPGLLRQHFTAVEAASAVGNAEVEGAGIGAASITLRPGPICPGRYSFSIGTAGSATLLLQTILDQPVEPRWAFWGVHTRPERDHTDSIVGIRRNPTSNFDVVSCARAVAARCKECRYGHGLLFGIAFPLLSVPGIDSPQALLRVAR